MQNLGSTQPGRRKRATVAQERLARAYKRLFTGHGGAEDAEIVLSDFAVITGFYGVSGAETSAEQLRFREGQRSVFARVLSYLRMTDGEMAALESAARLENLTSYEE